LNLINVCFLIFLLAVIQSGSTISGSGRDLHVWSNLGRFLGEFFPPDLSVIGRTLSSLVETLQIAVLATFNAIFLSLVIGLGATRRVAPRWVVSLMRMLLNVIRTIPGLIWAVIAVAAVGANAIAGVIALTFLQHGLPREIFQRGL
jgi:phosphonate transport system permease protein